MSASATRTEYPNSLRFDLSPDEIRKSADTIIASSRARLDAIVASVDALMSEQSAVFLNTPMQALSEEDFEFGVASSNAYFPSQVSADKAIRDASTEANQKLEAYSVEKELRHDVYVAVKRYVNHLDSMAKRANGSGTWESLFSTEEVFFTRKILQGFERNGLHLPTDKQSRLKHLRQEMSEISIKFQQNLVCVSCVPSPRPILTSRLLRTRTKRRSNFRERSSMGCQSLILIASVRFRWFT
jgi:Zn-dependent oligopeptidase